MIVAIVSAVVGPAAMVLLNWAANWKKSKAAATRDVAEARHAEIEDDVSVAGVVLRWSESLRDELAMVKVEVVGLKEQIAQLKRQNRALSRQNETLTAQVVDLGGAPLAMPEDRAKGRLDGRRSADCGFDQRSRCWHDRRPGSIARTR